MTYILSNLANNNTGNNVARIIIIPPIVGVPAFSNCPSNPKSLTDSPTCFFCSATIIRLPNIVENNNDNIIAMAALNVIN